MYDRRRYIRISEKSKVSYRVLPKRINHQFLTKDISQQGISFNVGEAIPEDSLLEIKVNLEKMPFSFTAIVKVRWIRKEIDGKKYEIGAEFLNIPEKALDYLINYIKLVCRHL